ncbi:MAG TPA: UDP-2,3-diacylglucosamine diphosphatase LpxI, partial [Rhizomicrobium sp.]|nr:UDP-2,3-diacylglucosamine diphosphatase LpxI [Rhizomicrobium sp.]
MSALGIIAGGGELPRAVAKSAREAGRSVFVIGLRGAADPEIAEFPHDWISLGEAGRLFRLLRSHDCTEVLFTGRVARPKLNELKTDTKGILLLPRVIAAARAGDDALLRALMDIISSEGFRAVGIADAAPGLLTPEGVLGRVKPDAEQERDIALGVKVVRALGALDVGQSAVVCAGLVLAIEAAEGTDAMILRVPRLQRNIRGHEGRPRGVLVKALKPTQDGKTDLPVIGVTTVENAHHAHL